MTAKQYATFLDEVGKWLHDEVPVLSHHEATRLMVLMNQRRTLGPEQSRTAVRWLQAWDRIYSEIEAKREVA